MQECFITTGATAKFPRLIQAVLTPEVLQAFVTNGFTHLNLQCGDAMDVFEASFPKDTLGLDIRAFGFKTEGLHKDMRSCQANTYSNKGLIITHAGMFLRKSDFSKVNNLVRIWYDIRCYEIRLHSNRCAK